MKNIISVEKYIEMGKVKVVPVETEIPSDVAEPSIQAEIPSEPSEPSEPEVKQESKKEEFRLGLLFSPMVYRIVLNKDCIV